MMKEEIKNIILNACVVHSKDAGTYQAIMDLFASESVKMLEWLQDHVSLAQIIDMEPAELYALYQKETNS